MTTPFLFSGKCAIVTGGSGGIGAAIARMLHEAGASVHVLDRVPPRAPVGTFHEVDVTNAEAVERAFTSVTTTAGRLDVVVACAGITKDAVLWKLTDEDWSQVLAVNLTGTFHCVRAAARHLREAGGGSIVLIASINGERGKFGQANYSASKAGMIGLAKTAARELGRFGIRVNVISPGLTETTMTSGLHDSARATALGETVLGRLATPEDIAGPVLFLCSDLARHVTGQVLRVDGGQYI